MFTIIKFCYVLILLFVRVFVCTLRFCDCLGDLLRVIFFLLCCVVKAMCVLLGFVLVGYIVSAVVSGVLGG